MSTNGQGTHEGGPTKSSDLNRLIKLMATTTIDNDNVALVALRKANEWLTRAGTTWEQLLLGKVSVMADPFAEIDAPPPTESVRPYRPDVPPRPTWKPPGRNHFCIEPGCTTQVPGPGIMCTSCTAKTQRFRYSVYSAPPRTSTRTPNPKPKPKPHSATPRTFAADVHSSTPSRKPAPGASDL